MIYFTNPNQAANSLMQTGEQLAYIDNPQQGNKRPAVRWIGDNGVFSVARAKKGLPWDEAGWWTWLQAQKHHAHLADFVVIPDVLNFFQDDKGNWFPVGDHVATAELAKKWIGPMKELGFKVAFVLQDGCTVDEVPWDDIDAVFIGGSDDWKCGAAGVNMDGTPKGDVPVQALVDEARDRGLWVHMGRVNSRKRIRLAALMGCDSTDGGYLRYGPSKNLPELLGWLQEIAQETEEELVAA